MIVQKDLQGNIIAEFKSKAEAARSLNCDEKNIRMSVKFGRKVQGKYRFYNSESISEKVSPVLQSPAKILILDVETAPLRSFTWGLWKQNVGLNQIISDYYIISWAAKYLGEDEIYSDVLTPNEALREDDKRIMQSLWELLNDCDIAIAHNGIKFDIPKINTRFVLHGIMPPSPYKQIDTLLTARNIFGFTSNRLDYLATFFGYAGKEPTSFALWEECMIGNPEALNYMVFYNKKDVVILEQVYLKLRPFMKNHPNITLYIDEAEMSCPHCGSTHIHPIEDKYFMTQAVRYQAYRCDDCKSISRSKQGLKYVNKKQISAIPR